jgi:hypothetical protein
MNLESGRRLFAWKCERPGVYLWVIYEKPKDYPEHFVVRRWWSKDGHVYAEEECDLFDTLEQARLGLPHGVANIGRGPADDFTIREVWI